MTRHGGAVASPSVALCLTCLSFPAALRAKGPRCTLGRSAIVQQAEGHGGGPGTRRYVCQEFKGARCMAKGAAVVGVQGNSSKNQGVLLRSGSRDLLDWGPRGPNERSKGARGAPRRTPFSPGVRTAVATARGRGAQGAPELRPGTIPRVRACRPCVSTPSAIP